MTVSSVKLRSRVTWREAEQSMEISGKMGKEKKAKLVNLTLNE